MKNVITLLAICIPFLLSAQTNIVWKGGTPGKETAWNEARNWNTNQIPGENDHVFINADNNGHFAQPVLKESVQVASINIGPRAELQITETGKLIVDGTDTYSEGISIYGGKLTSDGTIILKSIKNDDMADTPPIEIKKVVLVESVQFDSTFSAVTSH